MVSSEEERAYLLQESLRVLQEAATGSTLSLEALRTIAALLHGGAGEGMVDEALSGILERLVEVNGGMSTLSTELTLAFLIEICCMVSTVDLPSTGVQALNHLLSLLQPTNSSSSTLPPPNDHILVLRCLALLPLNTWDGKLGEEEMGSIMRGLESPDDSVRKAVSSVSPCLFRWRELII